MPTPTRKRKAKKRKPSTRKRSRRPSRPRLRGPASSSDEDFEVDSDGEEEEISASDDDEDEEEEEEEEEEHDFDDGRFSEANLGFSAASSRRRSTRSSRPRPANRTSRPSRSRRRRSEKSSDEDFDAVAEMERALETDLFVGEGAVATRSLTRATVSGQISDALQAAGPRATVSDQVSDAWQVGGSMARVSGKVSDSLQERRSTARVSDALHYTGSRGLRASIHIGESSSQIRNEQEIGSHSAGNSEGTVSGWNNACEGAETGKRKGKEKVLEEKEEQETLTKMQMPHPAVKEEVVCGVCLTEKALVERGKLNCCDHFFCFGCIMEWAKVESRCPMCKQRFVTIVKAGIAGSKRTRIVRIPLRDQVYIPPEDQDLPVEDLYADVVCMECHGTGDEGLLLLCDHCDSAAHTFCVGLGMSVPRGDWFCRACQALVAESSDSEDEEEELVLASSDEDEDEDSLIRAIVASGQPRSQRMTQTRVQRPSTSTTRSLPSAPRRRVRSGVRRRLRRRLSGRGRGRAVSAPRLSQAATALMESTISAPNQQLQASETPHLGSQSGWSARTVPQQRRLQERIHVMRSNWGRIQMGDLQFNALGMQSTILTQPVILNGTNAVPIPARASDESAGVNKITLVPGESSTQGERELEQAWRMMGHAQNLSAGINISNVHQQRSVVSHQVPAVSARQTNSGVTVNSNGRATNNVPCSTKSLDIRTNNPSPLSNLKIGNTDANTAASCTPEVVSKMNHDGQPLEDGKKLGAVVPALTADSGECSKELQRRPLGTKQTSAAGTSSPDCPKEVFRSTGSVNEKQEEELLKKIPNNTGTEKQATSMQGFESEKVNSSRHIGSADASRTHARKGTASMADKHDVSAAAGTNDVGNATFSSAYEGLKVHLTELVKKQIWPSYLTEGLGKEQFKQIARAAVHTLLALCDSNNESVSLSCGHLEHQGISPVASCCDKCLDQHVERAVKIAKHKVLPG